MVPTLTCNFSIFIPPRDPAERPKSKRPLGLAPEGPSCERPARRTQLSVRNLERDDDDRTDDRENMRGMFLKDRD
jgi:hypothetical protein